ncbi:MAG: ABC transporter substrate-binding protein [Bacillati bacterium ANGP1]|uniref:ABC transporter substrate-binding protein n=1 Tax=Candidatus Segetimicrobium genomatis TaxID=2569760 RepID=A0A537JK39_9BACT|nr:MAG: ABC transporter substrate-binding protein [Terrabacteria group bacterium ANGP1]
MGHGKIIAALTAATLAAGASPTLGAGAEQLSVVYAQASAAFTPLFAAQDRHFFAREGLEVRFTQITGSTAVATLVSGESQALAVGATEVADFDATGGDLVMVAAGSNYPVFSLYARKEVRSVQDLAGRRVAVTRTGTSTDTTARIILDHFGLTGKVEIMTAGGTLAGIMAAMSAGIAAGGIISPPTTALAEAAGFKELVNGVGLGIPMTQTALTVRKSYLAQHRETVLRLLRAFLASWAYIRNPANEAEVERAIAHYTRATPEQAAVAYKAFFPVWQDKVPRVDSKGVANAIRFSASPQVRRLTPASLIDDSLLQELVRSGYVKSLYPD